MRRKTLKEFIEDAIKVHEDKYDYSLIKEYLSSKIKVSILCRECGNIFWQIPNSHLLGHGCFKCSRLRASENTKKDSKIFIIQANIIHNNRYEYLENYVDNSTPLIIICKIHGEFRQVPASHLQGSGCPECGILTRTEKRKKDSNIFIEQANKVHSSRYQYLGDYINTMTPTTIICKTHGYFKQIPNDHLRGSDCPSCVSSISKIETKWLDSLGIPQLYRQKYVKINDKNIKTDAYDPTTNTIYEFHGDFWHGNPNKFNQDAMHPQINKTYGELYKNTIVREKLIKEAGYNLVVIWESDFNKIKDYN